MHGPATCFASDLRAALDLRIDACPSTLKEIKNQRAMIGVTIGVGRRYHAAARVAAECFYLHTKLPTRILTDHHFLASGLQHPAALKLRVFDAVPDDAVIYFDADWFCLNAWSPQDLLSDEKLVACHDFVLNADWPAQDHVFPAEPSKADISDDFPADFADHLRQQYLDEVLSSVSLSAGPERWINSGLMLLTRAAHAPMLALAETLYRAPGGHHPKYFEQPVIMQAIERLNVGISYLPRRFNVLTTKPTKWPSSVVGVHVKLSDAEQFPQFVRELDRGRVTPDAVRHLLSANLSQDC
jgi:hypothetical protein